MWRKQTDEGIKRKENKYVPSVERVLLFAGVSLELRLEGSAGVPWGWGVHGR